VRLHYDQIGTGPDIVWLAGGDQSGSSWHDYQVPSFSDRYRCTTYDARGVGETECDLPLPWPIADYGADCIKLIEAVCDPPVFIVGLSMGSLIAQQVALDRPDLVRCAVCMGTYARANRYVRDWEQGEVDFRRAGGTLTPEIATSHYAVLMYPSEVLGDDELWAKVRPIVLRDYSRRDGPELAAQWEACVEFDSLERLPSCTVPLHVVGFSQDVQAPPALGQMVADSAPQGHFHLLEGLGHCSCFGHRPEVVNAQIHEILAQDESTRP
jgi:pimeloyl-ACP methyl ester carboxylesterase